MKIAAFFLMLCVAGCASEPRSQKTNLVGSYASVQGGYNEEVVLVLKEGGIYVLQHQFIGDVIGADGTFENSFFGEDSGRWSVQDGVMTLTPSKVGTDQSPMFLPVHCGKFEVIEGSAGIELVSVSTPAIPAATPTKIVLKKVPQSVETTPVRAAP